MKKANKLLLKQAVMRKVVLATVPCIAGGVYFFGWQVLASVLVCCACGFGTEFLFRRKNNQPATEAVFVTGILFALIMPPNVPWHVLVVGTVFAVMFSKEVFGGFGRNIFNPAMAGRCFVYICFPVAITGIWPGSAPLGGVGALDRWATAAQTDAVTSATPMALMKAGGEVPSVADLFFGGLSGTAGVTSAFLILIGGLYLFYTKTANRTIILSVILPYAIINQVLTWLGVANFNGALPALLGGGFLFGAFFMATDPVSASKTQTGRIIYGIIIAVCTTVIRNFSIFNGGLMFSILLANMFAPIIDYAVTAYATRKTPSTVSEGAS
ncbi:MAG: RnfABCDGE type electron transport complex subunit D [Planctomycetota bacterium]|jgi:Na+-transporting NADH:ubiquinone oxidoreductase subunit B